MTDEQTKNALFVISRDKIKPLQLPRLVAASLSVQCRVHCPAKERGGDLINDLLTKVNLFDDKFVSFLVNHVAQKNSKAKVALCLTSTACCWAGI
jgi:hypothetical protein